MNASTLPWLLVVGLLYAPCTFAQSVIRLQNGTRSFRILHISDTHYHSPDLPFKADCLDIPASGYPCNHANTTALINSIIESDKPDMVAFTGDIIDGASLEPGHSMDQLYGLAAGRNLIWGASLGNHDEENWLYSREATFTHVTGIRGGTQLSKMGPVKGSPGNWYADVLGPNEALICRLVFFDSRMETWRDRYIPFEHRNVTQSINDAQLEWFRTLTTTLPRAPTLAFYHIPIKEMQDAVDAKVPMSGTMNEPIDANLPNNGTFASFQAGGVIAGFCGHDHTNDFCVLWKGVQLCYEGSPGFNGYGSVGKSRRARVTELRVAPGGTALSSVHTWKRVDAGGAVAGGQIDEEVLWSSDGTTSSHRTVVMGDADVAALGQSRSQPQPAVAGASGGRGSPH